MTRPLVPRDPGPGLEELVAAGQFEEALQWFRRTQAASLRTPQARLVAATAAARVGAYDTGRLLAGVALDQFAREADAAGRARALNLLGGIAFERGRLAEADTLFEEAARVAEDLGDEIALARTRNNLGMVAHLRGRPDRAIDSFDKALGAYESRGDSRGAAQTHHNLGLAFRELGDLPGAEQHVIEALHLAEASHDPPLVALTIMGRAELALAQGKPDAAAQDVDLGRGLAARSGDAFGVAEADRLCALVALRQRRFESAHAHAAAARRRAEELHAVVLAAECVALSALALLGLGERGQAEKRYQDAVAALRAQGAMQLVWWVEREWAAASRPPSEGSEP